jgi:hypothetical protein
MYLVGDTRPVASSYRKALHLFLYCKNHQYREHGPLNYLVGVITEILS